jgi:hypothetical protein
MIVIGLMSGASLISNTSYYTGSNTIARYLAVRLEDVQIANLDPSNISINPSLVMIFNVKAPDPTNGQMTLTHLSASVYLNQELLAYETFQKVVPASDRMITAGYNRNYTVGSTILELLDKEHLYNASLSGNWTFNVALTLSYYLFQGGTLSWRVLFFVYEGYTPI